MSAPAPDHVIIATRNLHKAGEIRTILGDSFRYSTLVDFPEAPGVVEDALTFAGNATKKAVELARWLSGGISNLKFQISNSTKVLADDSGLEVDALNGAPGVHSARFAALDRIGDGLSTNSTDAENNAKLLRLLRAVALENRKARFRCVIAMVHLHHSTSGGEPRVFDGVCEGRIELASRGAGGFGYDPLFVPDGFDRTFGELGEDVKNKLSHRSRALQKLKVSLQ
jgi:XTP/dITP diphosphohydrolase